MAEPSGLPGHRRSMRLLPYNESAALKSGTPVLGFATIYGREDSSLTVKRAGYLWLPKRLQYGLVPIRHPFSPSHGTSDVAPGLSRGRRDESNRVGGRDVSSIQDRPTWNLHVPVRGGLSDRDK